MTLIDEMERDIQLGESQELEFMESFPGNIHELAKEIAAFATSNPGTIYIGISNNGNKIGIIDEKDKFNNKKDELQNRIAGITRNSVKPSIEVRVDFIEDDEKLFLKIIVPKGREPVYYSSNIAYYRNLTTSQQASWEKIKELHRIYFQEKGTIQDQGEDKSVFFNILLQLSDFELLWTDYENRMINPDMEQFRYDIDVGSDILMKMSFESPIQNENIEGELQEISNLMKDLSHHRFFADGGKSFKKFEEKGNIIYNKIKKLKPRVMKRVSISEKDIESINDDLLKLIRELNNYWAQRVDFLKRGEIDLLKEHLRRIAYSFYRVSNIPAIIEGQKYSSSLREIAVDLRELSSVKYFMKGIGVNPIEKIEKQMDIIILKLEDIEKTLG